MKLANGTLVLAADGGKAMLFRNRGDEKFVVLDTLAHQEISSPPSHKTGADRPGRSFASIGPRRSGLEQTDWHRQDEERFARRVADLLEAATEHTSRNVGPAWQLRAETSQAGISSDLLESAIEDWLHTQVSNTGHLYAQAHAVGQVPNSRPADDQ